MINSDSVNQARKEIQTLKKENKTVVVRAGSPEFNRKIMENPDVDIITGLEFHDRKDFLRQRDSGLNEVLCRLARKNNIKVGLDLSLLNSLNRKDKAVIISRIIQNIKLCRRTNTRVAVLNSGSSDIDIQSFLRTLKASSKQASDSAKI